MARKRRKSRKTTAKRRRRYSNPVAKRRSYRRRNPGFGSGLNSILKDIDTPLLIAGGYKLAELLNNKVLKAPVVVQKDGKNEWNPWAVIYPALIGLGVKAIGPKLVGGNIAKALADGMLVKSFATGIGMVFMTEKEKTALASVIQAGDNYFIEGLGADNVYMDENGVPYITDTADYQPINVQGLGSVDYVKIK